MLAWATEQLDYLPSRIFFWVIAAVFAYGGAIHASNIAGLSGYQWSASPPAWQLFDVVFLILNAVVVAGVLAKSGWGVLAFIAAASLQVILYQFFPSAFVTSPEQAETVRRLLYFALGLLVIFAVLVMLRGRRAAS